MAKPYMLTRENAPAFWLIGIVWMPLATGVQTDNRLALLEQRMHNGSGPPSHFHTQDEGFYVLDGACTFHAGGQSIKAGAGTFISIPRATSHSFTVDDDPTHVLNFYFPAGFEMIILNLAQPAPNRAVPATDAVALPPRWMVEELSREYGQMKDLGLPFADAPDKHNMATSESKTNPIKPLASHNSQAPAYWHNDILWTILATGEQTGGSYSLMEELCPRFSGAPPHMHDQDEMFYLLEGTATFLAGDHIFKAETGAFLFIPRGTIHSFRVESETARMLNFYGPAGFEQTILELGQPTTQRTLPPPNQTRAINQQKVESLFERVGMHTVAIPDFLRSNLAPR